MSKKRKEMHIVYASDDNFAEILGTSLASLYHNNAAMDEIHVYVLDSSISDENKEKLNSVSRTYHRADLVYIQAKDISEELGMKVTADRGSLSQYARLFVSSVLPEHLERVLYLDCDIIIKQPLNDLWDMDMHGKTIAALKDAFSRQYRANLGLNADDVMFNSGVMLIDLKRWKEQLVEDKLIEFIASKGGIVQQGDQGALNAVLAHDVYCFEPRFNSVTIYYDFSYKELLKYRKPVDFYSEDQVNKAITDPVIIHFTTSFLSLRPWIKGCHHKYVDEWLKFKKMTPWREDPLWEPKKGSKLKETGVLLAKKMPRAVMIVLTGIAQAYIRPAYFRLKTA